jgi:hypothetical protein
MQKRKATRPLRPWARPKIRRLNGRSAQFGGEGQEDGDGLS